MSLVVGVRCSFRGSSPNPPSLRLEDAVAAGAFEPDLSLWDAWRPDHVAALLAGVQAPWYVAAGWAIDLFLGEERREHEDLEIAVPRERFSEVAATHPASAWKSCSNVCSRLRSKSSSWNVTRTGSPACNSRR